MSKKVISLSILLLLGFIWGTGYSIARFATTHGVPALGYSFWQALGPAILIGLFSFRSANKIKISVSHFRYYFISGLTGIVIPNTNMYFAAAHLPAGLLAVIVNTVPIIVYALAIFARIESFHWLRFGGILSALCGLMLIVMPQEGFATMSVNPWMISALITPISFAFCAIYISRFRPAQSDSLTLAAGTLVFAALFLVPLVYLTGNFYQLHFPLSAPDGVILLEIILSSLGYVLFFQLIKIAGPVYYSLVDTIVALTGLFWGFVLFHETLNERYMIAVILIFLALFLVTQHQYYSKKFQVST